MPDHRIYFIWSFKDKGWTNKKKKALSLLLFLSDCSLAVFQSQVKPMEWVCQVVCYVSYFLLGSHVTSLGKQTTGSIQLNAHCQGNNVKALHAWSRPLLTQLCKALSIGCRLTPGRPTVWLVRCPLCTHCEPTSSYIWWRLAVLLYDVVRVLAIGQEEVADLFYYVTKMYMGQEWPFKPKHPAELYLAAW